MARQIVKSLGSIPTVVILSQVGSLRLPLSADLSSYTSYQDAFYKHHSPEELELAYASRLDLDHPDAIDMPLFVSVSSIDMS